MTRIKYDAALMQCITIFENLTQTQVKDCIEEGQALTFVVAETQIGKAIGRGGQNVHLLERTLNRKIKIVEFHPDVAQFVRNMVYPLQPKEIRNEGNRITIVGADTAAKGILIGREGHRLRSLNEIVKRYFPVESIEVA
ncbi:MAG: NusA-like transcription termination signal-binding factor [Nanoarchaeota archaeon]